VQQLVKIGSLEQSPIRDDRGDTGRVRDGSQRIGIEQDQIG
jgi:hypothetical protein